MHATPLGSESPTAYNICHSIALYMLCWRSTGNRAITQSTLSHIGQAFTVPTMAYRVHNTVGISFVLPFSLKILYRPYPCCMHFTIYLFIFTLILGLINYKVELLILKMIKMTVIDFKAGLLNFKMKVNTIREQSETFSRLSTLFEVSVN